MTPTLFSPHDLVTLKSRTVEHLQDFLHQWRSRLGPSESLCSVWTLTWNSRRLLWWGGAERQSGQLVNICRGYRDQQLCGADVQQLFTRSGPVEWWQPASSRPCPAAAACCHSLGVFLGGLQPLFEILGGNTCTHTFRTHTELYMNLNPCVIYAFLHLRDSRWDLSH